MLRDYNKKEREKEKKNRRKFLKGLAKLTKETGIAVGGCGCCGSPYIYKVSNLEEGGYRIKDEDEHLNWYEPDDFRWEKFKDDLIKGED